MTVSIFKYTLPILFLIFFWDAIFSFFSQDDFYHIRQISQLSFLDLLKMVLPGATNEQTFYRPISREFFNYLTFHLFGLNSFVFHGINALLVYVNLFLSLKIIGKFSKNLLLIWLFSVFYLFNSVHSVELYYLSSVQTLLSTVWGLASVLFYIKYLENARVGYLGVSSMFFLLSTVSHESGLVFWGFFVLADYYKRGEWSARYLKKLLKIFAPFSIIALLRLGIFFYMASLPSQEVYAPQFSIKSMVNTFIWLSLWSLGLPEMLSDFMTLTFSFNPNLFRFYGYYIGVVFPLIALLAGSVVLIFWKFQRKIVKSRIFYVILLAFLGSMSPFLFFPSHKFSYYLSLPIIILSVSFSLVVSLAWQSKLKILGIFIVICFLTISWYTTRLNKDTHWAAKRSKAAKYLLEDIQKLYPNVEKGAIFYFTDDPLYPDIAKDWGKSSRQAFYILSGSDGLKLIYNDLTINAYFEDKGGLPKEVEGKRIYRMVAKFPY